MYIIQTQYLKKLKALKIFLFLRKVYVYKSELIDNKDYVLFKVMLSKFIL